MKAPAILLSKKVLDAVRDLADYIHPRKAQRSISEVVRMMGQSEMMAEADPAAEYFWEMLFYFVRILQAMEDDQVKKDDETIASLKKDIATLTKKLKAKGTGK